MKQHQGKDLTAKLICGRVPTASQYAAAQSAADEAIQKAMLIMKKQGKIKPKPLPLKSVDQPKVYGRGKNKRTRNANERRGSTNERRGSGNANERRGSGKKKNLPSNSSRTLKNSKKKNVKTSKKKNTNKRIIVKPVGKSPIVVKPDKKKKSNGKPNNSDSDDVLDWLDLEEPPSPQGDSSNLCDLLGF